MVKVSNESAPAQIFFLTALPNISSINIVNGRGYGQRGSIR